MKLNHVFLRLLDTCNLECAHCYASCGPKATAAIALVDALKLVDELADIGTSHVHLEGGEALIYDGIWELIDAFNRVKIYPAITSNGLSVKEKTLERLVGKLSKLTFSVDGHKASVHDQIRRRPGSFDRVVAAIAASKRLGIPTHMISVVWKDSVDHVDEIVELAAGLNVDRLLLFSCGKIGAAEKNWAELQPTQEAWANYLNRVRQLAKKHKWIWFEVDRVRRGDLPRFIGPAYRPICTIEPRDSVTIDPLGDVYPCGYFIPEKKMLGNIKERRLSEIVARSQDGERYSGACKNPWSQQDGIVDLCKLYSVNGAMIDSIDAS